MVSLASTSNKQKYRTDPTIANPAVNGSMSRASVSTPINYLMSISASSAQAQPPMFAEDVYASRRGQRSRHQAHR